MAGQNLDADTAKSMMTLAGGALVLIATAAAIINARLAKAKTRAARERIVGAVFNIASVFFSISGLFLLFAFDAQGPAIWLIGFSCLTSWIQFVRRPGPPERLEIFLLNGGLALFMLLVGMYYFNRVLIIVIRLMDVLAGK